MSLRAVSLSDMDTVVNRPLLVQQGRWYCQACQVLCTGSLPVGEAPRHHCGQIMMQVASIWEIEA